MTSSDVSAEFQQRRIRTWKAVRWWLLIAAVGGGAFAIGPQGTSLEITQAQFTFQLVCLVVVFVALFAAIRGVTAHYRCPRCHAMPMTRMSGGGTFSVRYGVDLNPSVCPKCGAHLRLDDNLRVWSVLGRVFGFRERADARWITKGIDGNFRSVAAISRPIAGNCRLA